MALRSGYKGFKKLLPGLKITRPGTLGIDNGVLIPELNKTFFPRSEQAVLGAVNIFVPTLNTTEQDGITWTRNADDTYTANGINSKAGNTFVQLGTFDASKYTGTFKFSCCPSGASSSTYFMQLYDKTTSQWINTYDYGNGFNIDTSSNHLYAFMGVVAQNASQIDNVLFSPMISIDGGTFTPPAMTNRELTVPQEVTITNIAGTQESTNGRRIGKLIDINIGIDAVTLDANGVLCKIPTDVAPSNNMSFFGYNTSNNTPIRIYVTNTGDIKTASALVNNGVRGHITYLQR